MDWVQFDDKFFGGNRDDGVRLDQRGAVLVGSLLVLAGIVVFVLDWLR